MLYIIYSFKITSRILFICVHMFISIHLAPFLSSTTIKSIVCVCVSIKRRFFNSLNLNQWLTMSCTHVHGQTNQQTNKQIFKCNIQHTTKYRRSMNGNFLITFFLCSRTRKVFFCNKIKWKEEENLKIMLFLNKPTKSYSLPSYSHCLTNVVEDTWKF
jgi:hypothetical protein